MERHHGKRLMKGVYLDEHGCLKLCARCGMDAHDRELSENEARLWFEGVVLVLALVGVPVPILESLPDQVDEWVRKEGLCTRT